ncbi:MAG: hypothetical protein V2A73_16380 [Pseudomonadota bacterium]
MAGERADDSDGVDLSAELPGDGRRTRGRQTGRRARGRQTGRRRRRLA